MPSSTKERRKREAVWSVAVFSLVQLVCVGLFIALCLIPDLPLLGKLLFGLFAVLFALPVILALVALKARFREIEGGELDAAAQY